MGLAGDLSEITFSEVVQLYAQTRRTATLVVNCPRTRKALGYFYFERGELFDAKLEDAEGLEAVYRALELHEGTFLIVTDARRRERRIFEPVHALLLEGMRRIDEARRAPPLKLVRASSDPREQGEDMATSEVKARLCPVCRKRFKFGEVCPDDGAQLTSAPADTIAPPPALRPPPRSLRGWWVAAAGVAVVVAMGIVWLRRTPDSPRAVTGKVATPALPSSESPAPAPSPAAAAAPAAAQPVERPAPPPPEQAPAKTRGVTDKEIKFGMAVPLTGPAKELGRQMKLGVETAFNAINDAGGIHGRRLQLIALDDGYEPTRTLPAMQALYDKEQVFAVIGNVGTPTATVALPFALEKKVIFFGAFTGASLLRRDPPDRYVFNYRASYTEETAAVVKYLVKVRRLRPDQIAVFAQQDAYGDAGYAGVAKALRGLKGEPATVLRLGYKRNTVDVADAVAKLRAHPVNIKAVVMVPTYRAAAKFIEKVRDFNATMIFTSVSFVGSTALAEELKLLGPKYSAGVIVTQVVPPVDSYSSTVLKYKDALAKYFPGENPDFVSLEGYIDGNLMAEALRRNGTEIDTERLVDTLEKLRDVDLGLGTSLSFGVAEHQASHKVWGTQLDENGKYQVLDLE